MPFSSSLKHHNFDKKNHPKITKSLLRRIFSFLNPYKMQLFFVVFIILISSILGVIPSILTGKIIDLGLIGRNFKTLITLILLSLILVVLSNIISLLESYLNAFISQGVLYDIKNLLYNHLQQMSYAFFMGRKQGEIITRMTEDVTGIQSAVSSTLTRALKNIGTVLVITITLIKTNWILAILGIALVPLFIIPTKLTGHKRWKIAREIQANYDESNQMLNETLGVDGQMLVKLFNKHEAEFKQFKSINKTVRELGIKELLTGKFFFITINIYSNFIPLLIYLIGGIILLKHPFGLDITVGEITVMVTLIMRIHHPLNDLLNLNVDITRSLALFERIFEYLDLKPEIKDSKDALTVGRLKGKIEFKNVFFEYEKNQPILKNITFTIKPSEAIAIVGSSGAGKSTLITLLPRLFDVKDGSILIDGIDIRNMTQESLRANIGMVTQDTYLFNSSIYENLLYANSSATEEQIIDACKKANIHDFIVSLPEKYNTLVGNRGLRLSGGEKQRISIARLLLKNPPIIILDEATSSLDSISESYIQEAIKPLLRNRTALVVAHRLSTIISSDRIIVLENGSIAASGSHEHLLKHSSLYKEFFQTQFEFPSNKEASYE